MSLVLKFHFCDRRQKCVDVLTSQLRAKVAYNTWNRTGFFD